MSDAGTGESKARWPWLVGSVLPLAATLSMLPVLSLLGGQQCPPETFYRGTLGAGAVTAGFVLLAIASVGTGILCFLRAQAQFRAQLTWFVTLFCLSGSVALLGLLFCAYGEDLRFCATSRDVLVHPSLFETTRSISWDDVRLVSTRCVVSKNRYADLMLQWADGTELSFSLADNRGVNRTVYEHLRALLAHRQYKYRMSYDVTPDRCPPGALELFAYFSR